MILRELIEALHYPDLLKEDIFDNNIEPKAILDRPVIINDGVREYEIMSIYVSDQDECVYVDVEECADDSKAG